jgi:hypothetical protein
LSQLAPSTLPAPATKTQHISPLPKHARQQPTRSQNATGSATNLLGRCRGVLGACPGASAAKPGPAKLQAGTRPHQPLRGRRRSGGTEGMCQKLPEVRTGSGARGGAVPVRQGWSRFTPPYAEHPPGPCRQDAPREPAALWARGRAPRARGSAVFPCGRGVWVLGAGPGGRGAPGRDGLDSRRG